MKPERLSYLKCSLCVSVLLLVCGIALILVWPIILKIILQRKLVLSPGSELYEPWMKTPFSIPLDFYLFNWTNPRDIYNTSVKPRVEQVGPYRYWEDYGKSNVTWNENGTVTFKNLRFWHYDESEENGDLRKNITIINPVLLAAAHSLRTWSYLIRLGFSMTLSSLVSNISATDTVDNIIFKGHKDPIIEMAKSMSFLTGVLPYDKFGFFYKRNGSSDFDGVLNMGTGVNSTLGKLYSWNCMSKTSFFEEKCSQISGSAGDFYEGGKDTISFYTPNLCRPVVLKNVGMQTVQGITGNKYILEDLMLDNGTIYPQNKCFCNGGCTPSGVMNISVCNYGSPMFISLPHFHRADPYFRNSVEGMSPDKEKHEFSITLEPNTGFVLKAEAKLQANVLLQPIAGISLLANVPRIYFPLMWTRHRVTIPDKDASRLKLLLTVNTVITVCGIVMSIIGLLFLCYIAYKKYVTKHVDQKQKEEYLYSEQSVPLKTI